MLRRRHGEPRSRRAPRIGARAAFVALAAAALAASGLRADDDFSTSRPAPVQLPTEILRQLQSNDPEDHLAGFAEWHLWREAMPYDERDAANLLLAEPRWVGALGSVVLYDMKSGERRLSAYKLLARIGGPLVFPYFVWAIDEDVWMQSPGLFGLKRLGSIPLYVQDFLRNHADPSVLPYIPSRPGWDEVRLKIEQRYRDEKWAETPWKPFDESDFVARLKSAEPKARRLAIRAITVKHARRREDSAEPLVRMLEDSDASVATCAAESLCVISCPAARGRLRSLVDDGARPIELRRACLRAVAHCKIAPEWTAEWMLLGMGRWPAELDEDVHRCVQKIAPARGMPRGRFLRSLRDLRPELPNDRARAIVDAVVEEE